MWILLGRSDQCKLWPLSPSHRQGSADSKWLQLWLPRSTLQGTRETVSPFGSHSDCSSVWILASTSFVRLPFFFPIGSELGKRTLNPFKIKVFIRKPSPSSPTDLETKLGITTLIYQTCHFKENPLQISDLMAPKTTATLRGLAPKANAVTVNREVGVGQRFISVLVWSMEWGS